MLVNLVLALSLVGSLAHTGLSLATSLAALVNAVALFELLRRHGVYRAQPGWPTFLLRVGIANAMMAVVVMMLNPDASQWLSAAPGWRIGRLAAAIGAGALAYGAVLLSLGLRPAMLAAPRREEH